MCRTSAAWRRETPLSLLRPGAADTGESCTSSKLRVTADRERAGSAGPRARRRPIDAVSVARKYFLSQPCQKPPGSRATVTPTLPRRAISSTILAPSELPTMSMPSRPCSVMKASTLSASASAEAVHEEKRRACALSDEIQHRCLSLPQALYSELFCAPSRIRAA